MERSLDEMLGRREHKLRKGLIFTSFLLGVLLILQNVASAQVKPIRRILILNELGPASPGTALVNGEIRAGLEKSPYQLEVYTENLETTLFPDREVQQEFQDWLLHKYRDRKPDVLIAVGPSPIDFLAGSPRGFFPNTPVVFCALSTMGMAGYPTLDDSFTGVWEYLDVPKSLDVALKLQPNTKHLVVVGGVAEFDKESVAIVKNGLRDYETRFDVTYLTDLDMPTLLERLKRLPRDSIVLFAGITEDAAGTHYLNASQSAPLIAKAANAPVFPFRDIHMRLGQGTVGGYVASFAKEGEIAGAAALRILNGEKPGDIPIVNGANVYMFDWHALQRWGLNERNLPPESIVLNRQPSFWELYWRYIIAGVFLLLAQTLAIVGLLWQRAERKKTQNRLILSSERLRDSEDRFRLAMNNMTGGLYTLDSEGLVTYINPAAESMFGWTKAELLGKKMHDVIHYMHADGTPLLASDCPLLRTAQAGIEIRELEDTFIRKDGSFFHVIVSASPLNRDGKQIGVVVGFRDDTLRRKAERAIRESEERFRLVANTAPVMIWTSGLDKLCNYFNRPWLEFTGRSLEAELGNGWTEGVHPEDIEQCLNTYSTAFDRGESFRMEYRRRRHDGEYRWILDSGVPRFNSDGSFAGYIGSSIDVTERKLAEEALSTMSQRLIQAHEEERTRIARELHDDLCQRLALLSTSLEAWARRSALGSQLRGEIAEAIKQLQELGKDVQALSHRLHSSKLEFLGLAAAAAGFCSELSTRQDVQIKFRSKDVPKELPQDVSLCLFRILQEALRNAIKHSGSQHFQVSLTGDANELKLTVYDSGIGFDVEDALRGSGIGLTSMKERLKLVNGIMSIDSKPYRGTTVQARVPLISRTKFAGAS